MAKLKIALWCAAGCDVEDAQRAVAEEWSPAVLSRPEVVGLALHRAVSRRPTRKAPAPALGGMPETVISLWLEGSARDAYAELGDGLAPLSARVDAWQVREVRPRVYDRTWPDGVPSPGVVQLSFVRPAPGRSRAACSRHWQEQHAPLALRIHVAMWSYVQDHVVETLSEAGGDLLGHASLHFRSRADLRDGLFDSQAGAREIYADITRFLSLETSQTALMSELILRTPPDHRA